MNFHRDEKFLSKLNLFTSDTMKNPWLQSSISITMIIIHNDYEVLSWLIIFITTNDFHQKLILSIYQKKFCIKKCMNVRE